MTAVPHHRPRTVLVVGTGLIGTSVALALRERGHEVLLSDTDEEHLLHAERVGAGRRHDGDEVDLAVVAVHPRSVAGVVCELLESLAGCAVTDTASVKGELTGEVESRLSGGLSSRFVGGHPLAGSERSGPGAARADLFAGCPWILTPSPATAPQALDDARWLAAECRAHPVVMTAQQHDRALALTSHLPQLVASALAARLATEPDAVLALAGQGMRDMTRLAGSNPSMWAEIASANAAPLVEEVRALATQLRAIADALQRDAGTVAVGEMLETGRAGHRRMADMLVEPPHA